jgi:hypothetical protein
MIECLNFSRVGCNPRLGRLPRPIPIESNPMIDDADMDEDWLDPRAVELGRDFDPGQLPDDAIAVIMELWGSSPARATYLEGLANLFGLFRVKAEDLRADGLAEGEVRDECFGYLHDCADKFCHAQSSGLDTPFDRTKYMAVMNGVCKLALDYPTSTEY